MKTKYKTTTIITLGILIFTIRIPTFCNQDKPEGLWEGMFMEQFRMEIILMETEDMKLSGKIRMYDGSRMIQDDEINNIKYDNRMISFMIPAKETAFDGQFNDALTELNGDFVFPDGSRHPVYVSKKELGNLSKDPSTALSEKILTEEFSPQQLMDDLNFLRGHLSDIHPQYHLYTNEEAYNALYETIEQNLGSGLNIREYYNLISPVIAKIGCSHTGIRLPEPYIQAQHSYNHYFPFRVFIKDKKAWVLENVNEKKSIMPGSEIVRINHVPMENIIVRLLSMIPSEGYNKTTKYHEINRDFGSYFNLLNNSEKFQIEYKEPNNGEIQMINVKAVSYGSYSSGMEPTIRKLPVIHPMNIELNAAILQINSFALPDVNEYLQLMDSTFQEIQMKKINNLVIDLRGNQGGHPIFAAILYSYLTSENFTYFQSLEEVPEFEPLYNPMQPADNNFKGNCYVLVDGGCLSTTGHLISLLRYHNRAIFIGEEPGSWFYCNDNSFQIHLPNTGIEVNIPRTTFITAIKGYTLGDPFMVDYPIQVSIQDLLISRDPYLEYAYFLINQSEDLAH